MTLGQINQRSPGTPCPLRPVVGWDA